MRVTAQSQRITTTADDGSMSAVPCTVYSIVIGKAVAGQTITLYDDAAGGTTNPIVAIDTTVARDFSFGPAGRRCVNGLSAIVSGGTQDIAVVFG
jgi:hypothetical protein